MNMAGMARTPALEQVAGVRRNLSVNDLPAGAQAEKQLRAVVTGRSPLQQACTRASSPALPRILT